MKQPCMVGQRLRQFLDEYDRLWRSRLALDQELVLQDERVALVFQGL